MNPDFSAETIAYTFTFSFVTLLIRKETFLLEAAVLLCGFEWGGGGRVGGPEFLEISQTASSYHILLETSRTFPPLSEPSPSLFLNPAEGRYFWIKCSLETYKAVLFF